jgi:hypothetical protein
MCGANAWRTSMKGFDRFRACGFDDWPCAWFRAGWDCACDEGGFGCVDLAGITVLATFDPFTGPECCC